MMILGRRWVPVLPKQGVALGTYGSWNPVARNTKWGAHETSNPGKEQAQLLPGNEVGTEVESGFLCNTWCSLLFSVEGKVSD